MILLTLSCHVCKIPSISYFICNTWRIDHKSQVSAEMFYHLCVNDGLVSVWSGTQWLGSSCLSCQLKIFNYFPSFCDGHNNLHKCLQFCCHTLSNINFQIFKMSKSKYSRPLFYWLSVNRTISGNNHCILSYIFSLDCWFISI